MSNQTPKTWLNALIGAVVTVVLSFTVFSPVLGGGVAGYLQRDNGITVGALAGVIAAIPAIFLAIAAAGFITILGFLGAGLLLFVTVLVLVPIWVIGLSALGGYLGVYLRNEL